MVPAVNQKTQANVYYLFFAQDSQIHISPLVILFRSLTTSPHMNTLTYTRAHHVCARRHIYNDKCMHKCINTNTYKYKRIYNYSVYTQRNIRKFSQ